MNCHEAEPLLFAERDGALGEAQRAVLAAHLQQCPSCRIVQSELAQSASAWRAADAAVAVPAIETEWHAIRRRLRNEEAPQTPRAVAWRRPLWMTLAATTAAVAVVAVVGTRWFRPQPQELAANPGYVSYVVVHNATDSTMVYEDQQSGWLVVWVGDTSAGSGT